MATGPWGVTFETQTPTQTTYTNPTPTLTQPVGTTPTSLWGTLPGGTTPTVNQQAASQGPWGVAITPTATQSVTGTGYNDAPQGQYQSQGDAWTGFAQRYAPGFADILLSNPTQIFLNQLQSMGMAPTGTTGDYGSVQALAPYADVMPVLYTMMNMDNPNALSPEAQVNYIANFARNMMTRGGSAPSTQGLLSTMFGDPTFQQAFLNAGNPAENVNATNDLINMIGGLSFNPFMRRGLQNLLDQASYQYLSGVTQAQNPGAYVNWLGSRYGNMLPFLTGR